MFKFIKNIFNALFNANKVSIDNLKFGLIPDKKDDRDYIKKLPLKIGVSPKTFSLRKYVPGGILNQKNTNACTGYAAANAMNILINRMLELTSKESNYKFKKVSPLWLYYYARKYDFSLTTKDEGGTLRAVVQAMKDPGAVVIDSMDENYSPTQEPPNNLYNLPKYKISSYLRIEKNKDTIETIQRCLDIEHLPVLCGIKLYEYSVMDAYLNGGILKYNDRTMNRCLGGHALCIIGYRQIDNEIYFEVVNCWGSLSGDSGFYYFPAKICETEDLVDLWTIDKKYF